MSGEESRSERLLALLLVQQLKSSPQRDKVKLLSLAGYSNIEIADLLETSAAVVAQNLYEARKAGGKKKITKEKASKKKAHGTK